MRVVALEEHYCTSTAIANSPGVAETLTVVNESQAESAPTAPGKLLDLGEGRLTDMDAAGIDVQVLSIIPTAAQELPPADAAAMARDENDQLAVRVALHPDRFAGFATLPTPDPKAAASELERCVGQHGFKGTMIHGHSGGRFLDNQFFWPILEAAEALDVPIYLHPTYPPKAIVDVYYSGLPPALSTVLSTAGWGWHADTGLHALRMIVGGVFDQFPRLQMILGHMGEMIPFSWARLDERLTPVCQSLKKNVGQYFVENFYATTSGYFTDPPLQCALSVLGSDRIMFSVDYPFSSNLQARAWFDGTTSLSPRDREKIAHENADRLLRLA